MVIVVMLNSIQCLIFINRIVIHTFALPQGQNAPNMNNPMRGPPMADKILPAI